MGIEICKTHIWAKLKGHSRKRKNQWFIKGGGTIKGVFQELWLSFMQEINISP